MASSRVLGGLPLRGGRPAAVIKTRTSRSEFIDFLRKKGVWLEDVEKHPVCLGVPLGLTGSSGRTVAVDVGLKNPASISIRELVNNSPHVHREMVQHALKPGKPELPNMDKMLRSTPPLPMAVITKEDMQALPIASPLHPDALQRRVAKEDLDMLLDPFFQRQRADPELSWRDRDRYSRDSDEFTDIALEAIPDADLKATAKRAWRAHQRKQNQVSLGMLDELNDHPELAPAAMAELARRQAAHAAKQTAEQAAAEVAATAAAAPAAAPAVAVARPSPAAAVSAATRGAPQTSAGGVPPASQPVAPARVAPASRSTETPREAKAARPAESPTAAALDTPEAGAPDTVLLGRLEARLADARARKDYLGCAELRDQIQPLRIAHLTAELAAATAAQDFMRCVEIKAERDQLIRKVEDREAKKRGGGR